jgi:hypothetical protein
MVWLTSPHHTALHHTARQHSHSTSTTQDAIGTLAAHARILQVPSLLTHPAPACLTAGGGAGLGSRCYCRLQVLQSGCCLAQEGCQLEPQPSQQAPHSSSCHPHTAALITASAPHPLPLPASQQEKALAWGQGAGAACWGSGCRRTLPTSSRGASAPLRRWGASGNLSCPDRLPRAQAASAACWCTGGCCALPFSGLVGGFAAFALADAVLAASEACQQEDDDGQQHHHTNHNHLHAHNQRCYTSYSSAL